MYRKGRLGIFLCPRGYIEGQSLYRGKARNFSQSHSLNRERKLLHIPSSFQHISYIMASYSFTFFTYFLRFSQVPSTDGEGEVRNFFIFQSSYRERTLGIFLCPGGYIEGQSLYRRKARNFPQSQSLNRERKLLHIPSSFQHISYICLHIPLHFSHISSDFLKSHRRGRGRGCW